MNAIPWEISDDTLDEADTCSPTFFHGKILHSDFSGLLLSVNVVVPTHQKKNSIPDSVSVKPCQCAATALDMLVNSKSFNPGRMQRKGEIKTFSTLFYLHIYIHVLSIYLYKNQAGVRQGMK